MSDYLTGEEFARQMSVTPAKAHAVTVASLPSPTPPSTTEVRHFVARLLPRIIPGTTAVPGKHPEDLLVLIDRPTVKLLVISYYFDHERHVWYLQCKCWPADIIKQARKLYDKLNINALLTQARTPDDGWHRFGLSASPHLSFAQSHLVYGFAIPNKDTTPAEEMDAYMQRYLSYWQQHQPAIRQYKRAEGAGEFATLRACVDPIHPLTTGGEEEFAAYFLHTERTTANCIPGFYLGFSVDYEEAVDLDAQNQMVPRIRARFTRIMQTWGDRLL